MKVELSKALAVTKWCLWGSREFDRGHDMPKAYKMTSANSMAWSLPMKGLSLPSFSFSITYSIGK